VGQLLGAFTDAFEKINIKMVKNQLTPRPVLEQPFIIFNQLRNLVSQLQGQRLQTAWLCPETQKKGLR